MNVKVTHKGIRAAITYPALLRAKRDPSIVVFMVEPGRGHRLYHGAGFGALEGGWSVAESTWEPFVGTLEITA